MSVSTVIEPSILKHFEWHQQNSQKNSILVNLFWQTYQMMPNSWVTVVNQELSTCLSAALRSTSSEISPRTVKAVLLRFTPFTTLRRACIWYPVGSGSWVVSHWWLTKITNIPACKRSIMLCVPCADSHVFCLWDSTDRIMESSQNPCKSARSLPLV